VSATPPAGRQAGPAQGRPPDPAEFLSGDIGSPGGPRRLALRRVQDRLVDARLALARAGAQMDRAAAAVPRRSVLALSVYRPGTAALGPALAELAGTRHDLRVALGAMGQADAALAESTLASDLTGGKFENLNALLARHPPASYDWLLVVDDDVELPGGFLDHFVFLAERFGLRLAQPAHRWRSHAAVGVTRRRAGSVVRETGFVEIGPVCALHSATFSELLPFPPLRAGWGLDAHWAAVARARGWPLGVVDATPIRHGLRRIASSYDRGAAVAEAREFLAGRPYLSARESQRTLVTHRGW
jgi:hypothetical protein